MNTERPFIPFHRPSIGDDEIAEVADTLRSGWLTTGPKTATFEREFAAYVQSPYALAMNSCTAALHTALAAMGIGAGDEVITTPLTFCATVNTILHVGATPVLADVADDGNIDPESVRTRITARTKVILPVHLAGLPCQLQQIWQIAKDSGLQVLEDAAHAVGSEYRNTPIGATGLHASGGSAAVAFSFYATKNITTAEGGMITTADPELYMRMKRLCLHGISHDAWNRYSEQGRWFYQVYEPGFKYNLSDVQSALGIHQLRRLDGFIAKRTAYAQIYDSILGDVEELDLPKPPPDGSRHAWHLYCIRLNLDKLSISRDQLIDVLRSKGIGTSVHFIPIPLHPFFKPFAHLPHNHCPVALKLYPRLVSLPLYPAMSEAEVEYVAITLRELISQSRRRASSVPVPPANCVTVGNI